MLTPLPALISLPPDSARCRGIWQLCPAPATQVSSCVLLRLMTLCPEGHYVSVRPLPVCPLFVVFSSVFFRDVTQGACKSLVDVGRISPRVPPRLEQVAIPERTVDYDTRSPPRSSPCGDFLIETPFFPVIYPAFSGSYYLHPSSD